MIFPSLKENKSVKIKLSSRPIKSANQPTNLYLIVKFLISFIDHFLVSMLYGCRYDGIGQYQQKHGHVEP
jgi:hypothetical protein